MANFKRKMPGRIHALSSTFSGIAGEARVLAELVRCGFRAVMPYWLDETDIVVLLGKEHLSAVIHVQVKSVQFLHDQKVVRIQSLKKR